MVMNLSVERKSYGIGAGQAWNRKEKHQVTVIKNLFVLHSVT